jgi:hypothetical protein
VVPTNHGTRLRLWHLEAYKVGVGGEDVSVPGNERAKRLHNVVDLVDI